MMVITSCYFICIVRHHITLTPVSAISFTTFSDFTYRHQPLENPSMLAMRALALTTIQCLQLKFQRASRILVRQDLPKWFLPGQQETTVCRFRNNEASFRKICNIMFYDIWFTLLQKGQH